MTFKESIRDKLIIAANEYYKLVGVDFIIVSDSFVYRSEYLLRFHKDNFLHLTGVHTKINAGEFFEKCLNGLIATDDFVCDSTDDLKGKVKEKLRNLATIGSFFEKELIFQEMFEKDRVKCKLATSDGKCTLGFISINKVVHVPLTLLNKNQIADNDGIINFEIIRKF